MRSDVIRLENPSAARAWSDDQRRDGHRVVLVPTMGALHAGHEHLIELAASHGDRRVVSIFVNPLQFDRVDDLAAYPRPIDDDLEVCRRLGVDAVYAPSVEQMYSAEFQTRVEVGTLADHMEGEGRPGHFAGVTTVVIKLLNTLRPDVAVFGQKDFQQLVIVERIAADLDTGTEIVRVPTVREADGLALSSRNQRLTPEDRAAAACIPLALDAAEHVASTGEKSASAVITAARHQLDLEPGVRTEYVVLADSATLQPLDELDRPAVLCVAVWLGDVRLIDNTLLSPTTQPR